MGDVAAEVGSMLTKLNVVVLALLGVEPELEDPTVWSEEACCDSVRVGPSFVNCVGAPLFLPSDLTLLSPAVLFDLAIGKDNPRSFPLLATPRPQVKVVLYPEQSLP